MDNKTITISTAPRLASMLLAFVFLLAGQMLFAQSKQVTGVVKDVTGETVIGASVVEKGTTNGTITDFDGNFKLTVGDKAVLQISFVGYQTQEINTAGKASFVVTLKEDSEMLEEVVVVGYGAQKKESVVGAISQVSSKELLQSPAANVSQAIAGKISGVYTVYLWVFLTLFPGIFIILPSACGKFPFGLGRQAIALDIFSLSTQTCK